MFSAAGEHEIQITDPSKVAESFAFSRVRSPSAAAVFPAVVRLRLRSLCGSRIHFPATALIFPASHCLLPCDSSHRKFHFRFFPLDFYFHHPSITFSSVFDLPEIFIFTSTFFICRVGCLVSRVSCLPAICKLFTVIAAICLIFVSQKFAAVAAISSVSRLSFRRAPQGWSNCNRRS